MGEHQKIDGKTIEISSGRITGNTTGNDNTISVYKGIPYAAPPVGALRWRPPQPVIPWDGIRPATAYGPAAPQQPNPFGGVKEPVWRSEDCLYLNVWTPATSSEERLAVMVWIHGGGFGIGAGSSPDYVGTPLAEMGVVVVSINYRLNVFGSFGHPLLTRESEHHASGNYCLMDQIAALKWVQANIARFGGNPGKVTLFGESAGSRSVTLLTASPLAKGLFSAGICQSGAVRDVSQPLAAREKEGLALTEKLGAKTLEDLRTLTYDQMVATGPFNANPIVDGWVIPDDPATIYSSRRQQHVPLIIGTNRDEMTLFQMVNPPAKNTVEGFRALVKKRHGAAGEAVFSLYHPASDDQVPEAMNRYATDYEMVLPARRQARWMAAMGADCFLYHFTRVPPTKGGQMMGAHHGAEIPYIFDRIGPKWGEAEAADRDISHALMTYWTRFAKTGNPNADGLPQWPAYTLENDAHMEFGLEIKASQNLRKEFLDMLDRP